MSSRRRWWRPSALSVRSKVVLSVLVMSALGMAVAWVVTDAIQTRAVLDRIDSELEQEVQEFRVLAERGIDPDTGEAFTSVEQLLRIAIERNVPGADEMLVTFVEGEAELYSPSWAGAVLEDAELQELVDRVGPRTQRVLEDWIETDVGQMHVIVVPVHVEGSAEYGAYVVGVGTDRALAAQRELRQTFVLVSLGTLVLVGAVAWWVVGRLLHPLELLSATAQQVGGDDLTRRAPVHGEDDVATLGRAFNTMLDRLAAAFEAQRQFLDDAGHELRTPLTVLRGHLELLEPDDPADVAETRALLLDETRRMSRIVEDLVLLAKSERPDFVVPGEVDLGPLTDDVLDKARALGDRTWLVDARAEGQVPGDEQRLTQAVLQLADNAVKFSRPGTRIAVGSAVVGSTARLWVRDEGPGVAPADRERIFERFVRVGEPDVRGSGLGLAIVAAVATGHGGTVAAGPGVAAHDGAAEHGLQVTLAWPVDGATDGGTDERADG
ncbi:HAMP domain-containing sensor histidine kinase [Isoptericola sp. AK164]|uniref:sensor histidine kinase n=1 Tax=Isoptericola sp. AK164 TaxID=3024246 RepID=UPI002418648F|nr:HAMP domain-containing sensor histidine kinase [Isoptericola sp. AK164]